MKKHTYIHTGKLRVPRVRGFHGEIKVSPRTPRPAENVLTQTHSPPPDPYRLSISLIAVKLPNRTINRL